MGNRLTKIHLKNGHLNKVSKLTSGYAMWFTAGDAIREPQNP